MKEIDAKTSLMIALAKMAAVDGHVNHFEQMNMGMLSNTLGVDYRLVNEAKKDMDNVPVVPPNTMGEKIEYFWRIVTMMRMDLECHPKELKLCQELGEALQIPENEVRGLIHYSNENQDKIITLEMFSAQIAEIIKDPRFQPKKTNLFEKLYKWFKK